MKRLAFAVLVVALVAPAVAMAQGGTAVDAGPDAPKFYIKLYQSPDRQGRPLKLTASKPNLGTYNNKVSSVRAYGRWRLCTAVNFLGTCKQVNHSAKNLAILGLDNKIESVQFVGGE